MRRVQGGAAAIAWVTTVSLAGRPRARIAAVAVLVISLVLNAVVDPTPAAGWSVPNPRHKPGPVTIRGVAHRVAGHTFSLQTSSRGVYAVTTTSATTFVEKGVRGRARLHEGDHVGVKGFVRGRSITAMQVRIYPVKAKAYDVDGSVVMANGSSLVVSVSGKQLQIRVTSATEIRVGSRIGTSKDVHARDHVRVRVQVDAGQLVALGVHVYSRAAPGKHVQVRGTIASVHSGSIVVSSGSSATTIGLSSGTRYYLGSRAASKSSLAPQQSVTVYACCSGHALVAGSVHIHTAGSHRSAIVFRGRVVSVSSRELKLSVTGAIVVFTLLNSTIYELGAQSGSQASIKAGDDVSVRAYRQGNTLQALRIHVYVTRQHVRSLNGVVSSVTRSTVTVSSGGKRFTVSFNPTARITLNGKPASLADLRSGDAVRVTGQIHGTQVLATRLTARRALSRRSTIRGTVLGLRGSLLTIQSVTGERMNVRLASHVRILLQGKPAPSALFPGVQVTLQGHAVGASLTVDVIRVEVKVRTVVGRAQRVRPNALSIGGPTSTITTVDVPTGVHVRDGARSIAAASVHLGADLRVHGYVEQSLAVRAISIDVLHPAIDAAAMVTQAGTTVAVRTATGEKYVMAFLPSTEIDVQQLAFTLTPDQIPVGARVHVSGRLGSNGRLVVNSLSVRLPALTVRGTVSALSEDEMVLQEGGSLNHIRLEPSTTFSQGSHPITVNDVVVGDDVSVDGYKGNGVAFAHKVAVHRRIVALDGTVTSLKENGFVLSSADGDHRVIVSDTTVFSDGAGAVFTTGEALHVTGYRRGDGSILAIRIRLTKRPKSLVAGGPNSNYRLLQDNTVWRLTASP